MALSSLPWHRSECRTLKTHFIGYWCKTEKGKSLGEKQCGFYLMCKISFDCTFYFLSISQYGVSKQGIWRESWPLPRSWLTEAKHKLLSYLPTFISFVFKIGCRTRSRMLCCNNISLYLRKSFLHRNVEEEFT